MDSAVIRETVNVNSENGLHLVPCSRIARSASGFDCEVQIHKESDNLKVDAKSVLDLMTLGASQGTILVLEARGRDAAEAVSKLVRLFETNFEGDGTGD